jgi:hypothetical protein
MASSRWGRSLSNLYLSRVSTGAMLSDRERPLWCVSFLFGALEYVGPGLEPLPRPRSHSTVVIFFTKLWLVPGYGSFVSCAAFARASALSLPATPLWPLTNPASLGLPCFAQGFLQLIPQAREGSGPLGLGHVRDRLRRVRQHEDLPPRPALACCWVEQVPDLARHLNAPY